MTTTAAAQQPAAKSTSPPAESDADPAAEQITLRTIQRWARGGEKFASLTCYDATTARWLRRAGIPILLVGDTAAEMILGFPGTIHAPLDFLLMITAAVKRGAPTAFVMGDMPFMSYQADDAEGIRNAGRFLTEGAADAVKVEVDQSFTPLVAKMARAGIPVVAHIGCRPQMVKQKGGYSSAGRTAVEAQSMLDAAIAMEQAGASMLLIEASPNEVSRRIVDRVHIPVIGCGAGAACHGQIVVLQDLLGLTEWQPSFATPIADFGRQLSDAAGRWIEKVRASDLGQHPYRMASGEEEKLEGESVRPD